MSYKLFLDDEITPKQASKLLLNWRNKKILQSTDWVIVKNHHEFSVMVDVLGIPTLVSFGGDINNQVDSAIELKNIIEHYLGHGVPSYDIMVHSPNIFHRMKVKKIFK